MKMFGESVVKNQTARLTTCADTNTEVSSDWQDPFRLCRELVTEEVFVVNRETEPFT